MAQFCPSAAAHGLELLAFYHRADVVLVDAGVERLSAWLWFSAFLAP